MLLPPILFEDEELLAFDKPSGLPLAWDRPDAVGPTVKAAMQARAGRQAGFVHRLDAEASGVVLCAKTKAALDFLSGQFQSKTVVSKHLALVSVLPEERAMKVVAPLRAGTGTLPAEFVVDLALGEDEEQPDRVRVYKRRGGRPSLTEFRMVEGFGRFAWLECRPVTSRRHQIRVHLAAAGAPVLNDRFYGDQEVKLLLSDLKRSYKGREEEKPLIGRLALHAHELTFLHPVTRASVTLTAPVPHDLEIALKYLRKFPAAGS